MKAALEGRRVVVTGGLGLIGSAVARAAATTAAAVTVVDAHIPEHGGNRRNLEPLPNVQIVERDVADADALAPHLKGADVVFNLAGQRSHTDSMRDPLTDLHHNCLAQLALLEATRAAAPEAVVVFASTRQVYGRVARLPADESSRVEPRDINGIHKATAEQYHGLYHRVHGLPTVVLRLTNTYGPGMRIRDARQGFLGAWVRALVTDEPFEVWGGTQLRDFTYVDDVADAFVRAAVEPSVRGGVYNLGGAEAISLRDLADLLVTLNGGGSYTARPLPPEAEAIDIGDYAGDCSAFTNATGWRPRVGLRKGIAETLAFYRTHAADYL